MLWAGVLVETIVRRQVADGERLVAAVRVHARAARDQAGVPIVEAVRRRTTVPTRRARRVRAHARPFTTRWIPLSPHRRFRPRRRRPAASSPRLFACGEVLRPLAEPRPSPRAASRSGDVACVDHESADSRGRRAVTPDRLTHRCTLRPHPRRYSTVGFGSSPVTDCGEHLDDSSRSSGGRTRRRTHRPSAGSWPRIRSTEGLAYWNVPVRVERGDDVALERSTNARCRSRSVTSRMMPTNRRSPSSSELPERYRQDPRPSQCFPEIGRRPVYRALLGRAVPLDSSRCASRFRSGISVASGSPSTSADLRSRTAARRPGSRTEIPAVAVDGEDGVHRVTW